MLPAGVRFSTFEEYLSYRDATSMEGRYELIEGALVQLPFLKLESCLFGVFMAIFNNHRCGSRCGLT
jgi:hypothetical protein